jgi:diguanylate cyclase (GGDEF)-like protein
MQEQFLLGAYFGLAVLMALVAAANAVAFSDRSFAAYAVYISARAAAQAGMLGIGGQYLWPDSPAWNDLSAFLLPVLAACSGIWFARVVTRPQRFSATLDWLSLKLIMLLALLAVVDTLYPTHAGFIATTALIIAAIALICALVFIGWQSGDPTMRWIALGFVPVVVMAPFPVLRNLGLVPVSFLTQYGLTLGAALETPLLFYGLLRHAAQRREARARAAALAQTEPLTGLSNQHTFEARLHEALLRSNRYQHRSALLMIDLSNHGWFAREHGRQIADYALVLAGSCLRKLARDIDIAARVGDCEFALLIEGPVSPAQAVAAATQLVARALQPSAAAVALVQAQAALRVVHVAGGRVVHRVAARALAFDLLVVDLEVLGHDGESARACRAGRRSRVEVAHVGLQHLRRVALRVDRDEHALHLVAVRPQQLLRLRDLGHRGRADVRALRVAEEHHHHLAGEVLDAARLAVGVGQREVRA